MSSRNPTPITLEAARLLGVPFRHIHGGPTFRYKRTPKGYELQYLYYFGVDGLCWMDARRYNFGLDDYDPQFYVVRLNEEVKDGFPGPDSDHS